MAQKFLSAYDEAVQGGRPCHRVSEYFCARGRGSLRGDLEQHARGAGMSVRLRREIRAYMACRLDDTVSESPHRDISHIAGRARSSKIPWWSASVRLRQNLAMVEHPELRVAMRSAWPQWKSVLAPAAKRMGTRRFLDAVHRAGPFGLVDCTRIRAVDRRGVYTQAFQAFADSVPQSARVWHSLRREFVNAIVADGRVYTGTISNVASEPPSAHTMALDSGGTGSRGRTAHFRILDRAVADKKHNLTLRWLDVKCMAMPMSIQKLSAVGASTGSGSGSVDGVQLTLAPDGLPEIVDFLAFLPWAAIRCSLQEWSKVCASTIASGLDVSEPVPASSREWVLADQSTPTIVIVDALLARGWRAAPRLAQCPQSHSVAPAADAMVFHLQRLRPLWKPYLQCLLELEALGGRGLQSLPAREKPAFYRAVLESSAPGTVAVGLPAPDYTRPVAGGSDGLAAAASCVDLGHLSDEPLPCRAVPVPAAAVAGPVAAAVASPPASPPPSHDGDSPLPPPRRPVAGEAFSSVWPVQELLLRSPQGPGGRSSSSSSSSSSSTTAAVPVAAPAGPGGPAPAAVALAAPRPIRAQGSVGMMVEGIHVSVDEHVPVSGHGEGYRRLIIRCPFHQGCGKRRNTGPAQTRHFGDVEPLWFLGAWAHRGRALASRAEHMAYTPTVADVREYGESGRWAL